MCFTSAVFDQWNPYVPSVTPQPITWPQTSPAPQVAPPYTNEELRELIDAFKQALEAAKRFDRLTKQPDCEDPDKAKLLERVAELEQRLDALEGAGA